MTHSNVVNLDSWDKPFKASKVYSLKPPPRPEKKPEVKVKKKGPPKVELTSRETKVPFGTKQGPLKIGKGNPVGKDRLFETHCDCGRSSLMSVEDILHNVSEGLGCGFQKCSILPFVSHLWKGMGKSLHLQLLFRLLGDPDDVFSYWGGSLEDAFSMDLPEAFNNFFPYCKSLMESDDHYWACKECDDLPFIEGNIIMKEAPDTAIKTLLKDKVIIHGQFYSMQDLATIMGGNTQEVMKALFECESIDRLLTQLVS